MVNPPSQINPPPVLDRRKQERKKQDRPEHDKDTPTDPRDTPSPLPTDGVKEPAYKERGTATDVTV